LHSNRRRTGSHETRRWREMDSNHRYRKKNNPFWLPALGPAIRLPQEKPALSCRDRCFESISLQRGVTWDPELVLVIGTVGIFASSARLRRSLERIGDRLEARHLGPRPADA